MTPVTLEHVTKRLGDTIALDDTSITIEAGELFFLLGPSGCGKSTLLRLVAGLHEPSDGRILFGDKDVTRLGTDKRNAVMCFQSYALWPHMSVRDNVKFGLDVKGVGGDAGRRKIDEVLELVQMTPYADRRPNQLSGGQQQRVALARAIAVEPDVLLLDEPLSNLDAKLRHDMRSEIRRICKASGLTTVYVTHDQKEALSVADRIAVLRAGRVAQIGSPGELYHRPRSAFVADFVGQTNLIGGKIVASDDVALTVQTSFGKLRGKPSEAIRADGDVTVSVRPEQMRLVPFDKYPFGDNRVQGVIRDTTFLGEASEHTLIAGGGGERAGLLKLIVAPPRFDLPENTPVAVEFEATDAVVLPASGVD